MNLFEEEAAMQAWAMKAVEMRWDSSPASARPG